MLNSLRVCLRGDTTFIYDDKINISPVYAKNCLIINNLYVAEEKIIKKLPFLGNAKELIEYLDICFHLNVLIYGLHLILILELEILQINM